MTKIARTVQFGLILISTFRQGLAVNHEVAGVARRTSLRKIASIDHKSPQKEKLFLGETALKSHKDQT